MGNCECDDREQTADGEDANERRGGAPAAERRAEAATASADARTFSMQILPYCSIRAPVLQPRFGPWSLMGLSSPIGILVLSDARVPCHPPSHKNRVTGERLRSGTGQDEDAATFWIGEHVSQSLSPSLVPFPWRKTKTFSSKLPAFIHMVFPYFQSLTGSRSSFTL